MLFATADYFVSTEFRILALLAIASGSWAILSLTLFSLDTIPGKWVFYSWAFTLVAWLAWTLRMYVNDVPNVEPAMIVLAGCLFR